MDVIIKKGQKPCGSAAAPVSKSEAHRLLICAALSDKPCRLLTGGTNDDIEATVGALTSLGAKITPVNGGYDIIPINNVTKDPLIDCKESGSTLRFMLPVAAALGADASFTGSGRLPERPLSPLYELMSGRGVRMSEKGKMPLSCRGRLSGDDFEIDGSVSSQFITGLLLASPLMGKEVTVKVTGKCESRPYIDITLSVMRKFGVNIESQGNTFTVSGSYKSPETVRAGGDWSSAAFWLTAGALSDKGMTVTGLESGSAQGDRNIVNCLKALGADISEGGSFTARPSKLKGCVIDCADIPDLVPILSVAAAFADGETVFENISRLRSKESDRVLSVCALLDSFGIKTAAKPNRLTVTGGIPRGSYADSFSDHRIAMSAAILASVSGSECRIKGAECVSKSYPAFFDDLMSLGVELERK